MYYSTEQSGDLVLLCQFILSRIRPPALQSSKFRLIHFTIRDDYRSTFSPGLTRLIFFNPNNHFLIKWVIWLHLIWLDRIMFSLQWLTFYLHTCPLLMNQYFIFAYPTPCLGHLLLLWDCTNYLLTKEKAFRWQDGESISRTIFHCGVWYCFTVCVLCAKKKQAQFDKKNNIVVKFRIRRLLTLCGSGETSNMQQRHLHHLVLQESENVQLRHRPSSLSTYLWLPTSFAFHLFQSFDRLLALWMFCRLVCYRRLAVDFHSASPLLGQKLWVDSRQNSSIWNSHPSKELTEARYKRNYWK